MPSTRRMWSDWPPGQRNSAVPSGSNRPAARPRREVDEHIRAHHSRRRRPVGVGAAQQIGHETIDLLHPVGQQDVELATPLAVWACSTSPTCELDTHFEGCRLRHPAARAAATSGEAIKQRAEISRVVTPDIIQGQGDGPVVVNLQASLPRSAGLAFERRPAGPARRRSGQRVRGRVCPRSRVTTGCCPAAWAPCRVAHRPCRCRAPVDRHRRRRPGMPTSRPVGYFAISAGCYPCRLSCCSGRQSRGGQVQRRIQSTVDTCVKRPGIAVPDNRPVAHHQVGLDTSATSSSPRQSPTPSTTIAAVCFRHHVIRGEARCRRARRRL